MMDNRYNWHPLYKYVCQVVEIFREGATFYSTNFEEMLNFISENCIYEEVKELLEGSLSAQKEFLDNNVEENEALKLAKFNV